MKLQINSMVNGMGPNDELVKSLHDWLGITSSFVNDIVICHSFQTCNSEMKQRIKHLLFILKLVQDGNSAELFFVLEEHKSLLV